ncbi:uncharacterized protein BYT42DRAFT_560087 [Radiomyces spectabilis]|uniref:uncharacterized protein n=1 Tax=Radiomyces spectabilis TaxID=64574 RepID=UPI00221E723B|nr:uncharacterized protein BYT42DRAFT_560087 [Radiomyces spectabilis]KAI8388438.1 hypothetical protein BYT42DRAFT_560087 [Radiomyces spectabilis]
MLLSVVELSSQQLQEVKFVHHSTLQETTIVSKPGESELLLSLMKSSLLHLEDIVVKQSSNISTTIPSCTLPSRIASIPKTAVRPPTPTNPVKDTPHPSSRSQSPILPSKKPPPIPPKPTNIRKPAIPPKPSRLPLVASPPSTIDLRSDPSPKSVLLTTTPTLSTSLRRPNRHRGNSVSFAEQTSDHEISDDWDEDSDNEDDRDAVDDEDEEDDDDDEIIDFEQQQINVRIPPPLPITQRRNQTQPSLSRARPHTMSESHYPTSASYDTRHCSLIEPNENPDTIPNLDIFADAVIDPSRLVPAQTSTGDTLALPSSTQITDYVPNIPIPPLLTTHRRLQHRLDELDTTLNELKSTKRSLALSNGQKRSVNRRKEEDEIDVKMLQKTACIADTREILNKVRTLYMSAATVPSVMQFPPHLVAYQLTLIESAIFRDIPANALLSHSAKTPHPKIVASTDFFNYITRAIEHSILLPQEASRRAELINRWIKLASKCLALNNYQTLKAIVSALGTPPVQRLRRTWDCIPKKRMGRLEFLNVLMSETDNYGRYREHMELESNKRWHKPVVPFLGIFIHDMTYLLVAAKGLGEGDGRVQELMQKIQAFQETPDYPARPPTSYIKASTKHSFRPTAITNALHRNSSAKNRTSNHALFGIDSDYPEKGIELEQQLITQYILMRPWVNEKIIDELSVLREPPKPRSGSSPAFSRVNSVNHNSPLTGANGNGGGSNGSSYASSILSNASSIVRLSTSTQSSLHLSADDPSNGNEESKQRSGFWPFSRKSSEMNRPSVSSDIDLDRHASSIWSDDGDEEDDEPGDHTSAELYPHRVPPQPRTSHSISSRRPSTTKSLLGHTRSFSLPSNRPAVLAEASHSLRGSKRG